MPLQNISHWATAAAFSEPRDLVLPGPWVGHIPFVQWLVAVTRPKLLVELGTYTGNSYLAMCQALMSHAVAGRAIAIDTWEGDEHSGRYGSAIFDNLRKTHDPRYGAFSTLLKSTFDDARPAFKNGTIDLLHIDGLHTYEAVRHDFETWRPTLSNRAVVLLHDTNVHERGFGVWKFWAEISREFPSFNFTHSNGLGVLLVGGEQPDALRDLADNQHNTSAWAEARAVFQRLGGTFELQSQITVLQNQLCSLKVALDAEHATLGQRDADIANLKKEVDAMENRLAHATSEVEAHKASAEQLQRLVGYARDQRLRAADLREMQRQEAERRLGAVSHELNSQIELVHAMRASTSWRLTRGLRFSGKLLRKVKTVLRLAGGGDLRTIAQQLRKHTSRVVAIAAPPEDFTTVRAALIGGAALRGLRKVGILATPHTLFVAHGIQQALEALNISTTVATQAPAEFEADLYFVVCPQMFADLPPPQKRICVQMEQSVSSRWFTDDYLNVLKNSLAVLDYSRRNLAFLEQHGCGYPLAFHVPIGGIEGYVSHDRDAAGAKDIDVLFYGDDKNPRRQRILNALSAQFNIHIANDLFGEALQDLVRRAKVVLNVHYYENSLLETTRIYECLSLGASVVSETALDQNDHAVLSNAVTFAPVGDVDALAAALREALQKEQGDAQAHIKAAIQASQKRFDFMFARALLALNAISYERFALNPAPAEARASCIVLSMPETTRRRAILENAMPPDATIFDGLRATPGWKGCASSYKYLAEAACAAGSSRVTICEDDVLLPAHAAKTLETVHRFLDANDGKWDIFAGLIADLHADTKVLDVQEFNGMTFVTLDKMTSMVFNIYSRRALELISQWSTGADNVVTDTIDRYLERMTSVRTVTTLPFMAGHREEAHSSLWNFANTQYSSMIDQSEQLLADKVWEFRTAKSLEEDRLAPALPLS